MALVGHVGLRDSQERSRANSQGVLCWRWCLTSPGRNPAVFSSNPLSIPARGVLCLSCRCRLLQLLESHLLKVISSISEHRRGEREMFRAVQHSCKLWYLWLLFLSRAGMLWRGGNCAAGDNAEGCSGFCRASSPFQSHSTVKQRDLVLFQCLGLLPEEWSREAK